VALAGRRSPRFFVEKILGCHAWSKQLEILEAVRDNRRTAVRSAHGVGKTRAAAYAALWWLHNHPRSRVVTTAPTWAQVEELLWREIRTIHGESRVPLDGEPHLTKLEIATDWVALGMSTDQPERFQGHHAESLLLVVDEASGVDQEIYSAAEGFMTAANARVLLIGNPTRSSGQFHDAFHGERKLWKCLHISAFDCPDFTGEAVPDDVAGKLTSKVWVQERRDAGWEGTPAWDIRVLGEFSTTTPGALWTSEAINAGRVERHPDLVEIVTAIDPAATSKKGSDSTGIVVAGLDAAGEAYLLADRTCKLPPVGWAEQAVIAHHQHEGDRIVAEVNNGGEMVEHVIRSVDEVVPYRAVHASRGKATRAEPVAALYGSPPERPSRIHHVGRFPDLEQQLCSWVPGAPSPDRLDALVWAITDLMLRKPRLKAPDVGPGLVTGQSSWRS